MAPEVIHGNSKSYGRKADIWSVGAGVIEMTTGKPPFYDLPPLTALFKLGSSDILPEIPPSLSREAKHFLLCCFQRFPFLFLICFFWGNLIHSFLILLFNPSGTLTIAPLLTNYFDIPSLRMTIL